MSVVNMSKLKGFEEVNGNFIHPTAYINWDSVEIGTGNVIYPYVCIGTEGQSRKHEFEGIVSIGNNNTIREFTNIHLPTKQSKSTKIHNNVFIMSHSHIAHDVVIEDDVTISTNTILGGYTYVMKGVNTGLGTITHQYQCLGSYVMTGMNSTITKNLNVLPGGIWVGSPAKYIKENKIGLEKHAVSKNILAEETERFMSIKEKVKGYIL